MSATSYREILDEKGTFIATPEGVSMLPMLRCPYDSVKIVKVNGRCKKYDVILYQRPITKKYVLHRIVKVKKDSYYLCGDNQVNIEKHVVDAMIIGVVEGFYRGEQYIPVTDPKYIEYYKKRVRTRIFRWIAHQPKRLINKITRMIKKEKAN